MAHRILSTGSSGLVGSALGVAREDHGYEGAWLDLRIRVGIRGDVWIPKRGRTARWPGSATEVRAP